MRIQREVEETPQLVSPLINVTTNFTVLLEPLINLERLMTHLLTGGSAHGCQPSIHAGGKKLRVNLAGGRDAEDSVEGYGEKEHPSPGHQASSAMLFKGQCVSRRKKTPSCFYKQIFLKLSRSWYVS